MHTKEKQTKICVPSCSFMQLLKSMVCESSSILSSSNMQLKVNFKIKKEQTQQQQNHIVHYLYKDYLSQNKNCDKK